MKKRVWGALICLVALLVFASCGADEGGKNPKEQAEQGTVLGQAANGGYWLKVGGSEIHVGALLPELPAADSTFSAESCAIKGLDKTYTYGSVVISTEDDGTEERVVGMAILDDGAATEEGLTIGDTAEKAKSLYGTPTEETGTALRYAKDGMVLKILLRDGSVTSIVYELAK